MHDPRPAESFLRLRASSPPGRFATPKQRIDELARWVAVALGFSIPVSVAADNVLLSLILGYWLLGGGYREKVAAVRANPVAVSALLLLALYVVGTAYTIGSGSDVLETLAKASRLLLIPALLPLMRERVWRGRAVAAFLLSMLVSLAISYLFWLGAIPVNTWLKGTHLDPVAFKAHITHNIFMAFAAFLFALAALDAPTRRERVVLLACAAAAVVNVLLMVPGRTGHVVLLVLFAYLLVRELGLKGLAIAGAAVGALATIVALSPGAMLHKRITLAEDEYQQWRAGVPADARSSVGLRLGYLRNTAEVIRGNPVFGVGTGGFAAAYAAQASRTGDPVTRNPHNEFLLMIAQFGLPGLALLLLLFAAEWRVAPRLQLRFEQGAARALVLTIGVASALTSTLVDHSEGLFFVYMSGVLFAGHGVERRAAAPARPGRDARPLASGSGPSPAGR